MNGFNNAVSVEMADEAARGPVLWQTAGRAFLCRQVLALLICVMETRLLLYTSMLTVPRVLLTFWFPSSFLKPL